MKKIYIYDPENPEDGKWIEIGDNIFCEFPAKKGAEDNEARLDLINVHAELSMLCDRVQKLERECAELRTGLAQHENGLHGKDKSNHTTPLQDRVVAHGRHHRSSTVNRSNIPGGNEIGECSLGDKRVRNLSISDLGKVRQCFSTRRARGCGPGCVCNDSEST